MSPFDTLSQARGKNMKTFINMLNDESGAAAAEYALILAIVGSAIALAAVGLGNSVGSALNRASAKINATTY